MKIQTAGGSLAARAIILLSIVAGLVVFDGGCATVYQSSYQSSLRSSQLSADLAARAPATAVIAPEELLSRGISRNVKWVNPDGSGESLGLTEIEIPQSETLAAYTEEYLRKVYGDRYDPAMRYVRPLMIVLHSMAVGTLRTGLEVSGFLEDEVNYGISKWGRMPTGSHFIVERDGSIYCFAPPRAETGEISYSRGSRFPLKRHVIEANPWAIGIENIAPRRDNWTELPKAEKEKAFSDLTDSQIEADAKLARWLATLAPSIAHLYSHDQFMSAEFTSRLAARVLPVAFNPAYVTTSRYDTGPAFLAAVRERAARAGLHLTSD